MPCSQRFSGVDDKPLVVDDAAANADESTLSGLGVNDGTAPLENRDLSPERPTQHECGRAGRLVFDDALASGEAAGAHLAGWLVDPCPRVVMGLLTERCRVEAADLVRRGALVERPVW